MCRGHQGHPWPQHRPCASRSHPPPSSISRKLEICCWRPSNCSQLGGGSRKPAPQTFSGVHCAPITFQPSRDPSTGWHRRRRRNDTPTSTCTSTCTCTCTSTCTSRMSGMLKGVGVWEHSSPVNIQIYQLHQLIILRLTAQAGNSPDRPTSHRPLPCQTRCRARAGTWGICFGKNNGKYNHRNHSGTFNG